MIFELYLSLLKMKTFDCIQLNQSGGRAGEPRNGTRWSKQTQLGSHSVTYISIPQLSPHSSYLHTQIHTLYTQLLSLEKKLKYKFDRF